MMEPSKIISEVWNDGKLRKIFLDIINNTQLKKCRQLRAPFIKKIDKYVERSLTDAEIYGKMRKFIRSVPKHLQQKVQHQGHYRGINRTTKIMNFVNECLDTNEHPITRVLDIGCGDGSITKVVQSELKLSAPNMHACDITPINTDLFTFTTIQEPLISLPYPDEHFDIVYALMSLHHIRDLSLMLREVQRVLRPGGLLIIREHDCVITGLARVLDIVHGFYSMVWCHPQEHECFQTEYFAHYRTAVELDKLIESTAQLKRQTGTNRDEEYPLFYHGKVINPLKHYWAVYKK